MKWNIQKQVVIYGEHSKYFLRIKLFYTRPLLQMHQCTIDNLQQPERAKKYVEPLQLAVVR